MLNWGLMVGVVWGGGLGVTTPLNFEEGEGGGGGEG